MSEYQPPKVWQNTESGGKFASINRPTAGAREDRDLPVGDHPFQLYSLGTPNGQKATIMFEELLEAGEEAQYDAWKIDIGKGDQFTSGFVDVNPNSKIPALCDRRGGNPMRVFESGAILLHLAGAFGRFLPKSDPARTEALSWLFWQVGSAPLIGGGFGHFYHYAPEKLEYPIDRYAMETKRLFDVADRRLAEAEYLAGEDYTIADIAAWPWLSALYLGRAYDDADVFLSLKDYEHVGRWVEAVAARPGVKRGRLVNRDKVPERHSAADFGGVDLDAD